MVTALSLLAAEAVAIPVEAVALIGAIGVGAVVAIGSALIALGGRRTRTADDEEVPEPARP